jgi:hypothetical protein
VVTDGQKTGTFSRPLSLILFRPMAKARKEARETAQLCRIWRLFPPLSVGAATLWKMRRICPRFFLMILKVTAPAGER